MLRRLAVLATVVLPAAAQAYKPEIGEVLPPLAVLQTGGQPIDWALRDGAIRILVVGASWCPPCQDFKTTLPNTLTRLRQAGIDVSAIYIDADNFKGSTQAPTNRHAGLNVGGFIDAVPDPSRIDLKSESPTGVRDWGAFRAYGYPTTILLDSRNVVVDRYRGGNASRGVADDAMALGKRSLAASAGGAPRVAAASDTVAAAPAAVKARRAVADAAADDLIGLWRFRNPEGATQELFLRVVGVTPGADGRDKVEVSLTRKLTSWLPIEATSEGDGASRTFRFTTRTGGQVAVVRQPDGTYAGTLMRPGSRVPTRPITIERMGYDEAEM